MRMLRARTILYPLILIVLTSGLGFAISTKYGFDARIIRGKGQPFTNVDRKTISNTFNIRLVNRSDVAQHYTIEINSPENVRLEVLDVATIELQPKETSMVPINVRFEPSLTLGDGHAEAVMNIADVSDHHHEIKFTLLGPR